MEMPIITLHLRYTASEAMKSRPRALCLHNPPAEADAQSGLRTITAQPGSCLCPACGNAENGDKTHMLLKSAAPGAVHITSIHVLVVSAN